MKDEALQKIYEFMNCDDDDLDTRDPLDHFTEEQIDQRLDKLDEIQAALEHEINDYSLEQTKDVLQIEDDKDIYRVMIFSKGVKDYIIVFGSNANMTAFDKDAPNDLMAKIFNVTVSLNR